MNPVGKADMVAFLVRQLGTLRGLEDGEKAQHIAGNLLQIYEVRTRDMLPSTTEPCGTRVPGAPGPEFQPAQPTRANEGVLSVNVVCACGAVIGPGDSIPQHWREVHKREISELRAPRRPETKAEGQAK